MLFSTPPRSAGLIATDAFFSVRKEKVSTTFSALGVAFCNPYQVPDSARSPAAVLPPECENTEQESFRLVASQKIKPTLLTVADLSDDRNPFAQKPHSLKIFNANTMKNIFTLLLLLGSFGLFGQVTVDFTDPATATWGTNAQRIITVNTVPVAMMWAGDANGDGKIIYQGPANDLTKVLTDVLSFPGNFPGFAYNYANATGYFNGDVNMNGTAIYQGQGNDLTTILTSVLAFPGNFPGFAYNFSQLVAQIPQ